MAQSLGDPYRELGIARDATDAEIRAAFVRAARAHHSDLLGPHARPEARRAADAKLDRLSAARDVLLDRVLRHEVDTLLAQQSPASASPRPRPPVPGSSPGAQAPYYAPTPPSPAHRVGSIRATVRELDALLRRDERGMSVVAFLALPVLGDFLATHSFAVVLGVWMTLLGVQALLAGRLNHTPLAWLLRATRHVIDECVEVLARAREEAPTTHSPASVSARG